jgi:hypothetical protein
MNIKEVSKSLWALQERSKASRPYVNGVGESTGLSKVRMDSMKDIAFEETKAKNNVRTADRG